MKSKTNLAVSHKYGSGVNVPANLYEIENGQTLTSIPKNKFMDGGLHDKRTDVTVSETNLNPETLDFNSSMPFSSGLKKVNFSNTYKFVNPAIVKFDVTKAKETS